MKCNNLTRPIAETRCVLHPAVPLLRRFADCKQPAKAKRCSDFLFFIISFTVFFFLAACSPDEAPNNPEPAVTVTEATDIMHTEATLCGRIDLQGNANTPELRFLLSTDDGLTPLPEAPITDNGEVRQHIDGLKPATTYHFCLEADNGRTAIRSNIISFTTLPSDRPAILSAADITHTGATLRGKALPLDNGSMPELRFMLGTAEELTPVETDVNATGDSITLRLSDLTPGTTYSFCLRAFDGHNTTYSDTLRFTTVPSDRPAILSAADITRTGATLRGKALPLDNGDMPELRFMLGTAEELTPVEADISISGNNVTLSLDNLTPGTTYSFCLRAFDGHNTTYSDTLRFTTVPNDKPTVTAPVLSSRGPTSAFVTYAVTNNGGERLTATGLYITDTATGRTFSVTPEGDINADTVFTLHVTGLQPQTAYEIKAYAANTVGESQSASAALATGSTVVLTAPGLLETIIGADVYEFDRLAFSGPMNGDDLRFLRRMMGCEADGSAGRGRLADVDMTEVSIVSGGGSYDGSRFTADGVVGQGLFAGCAALTSIALPASATTIEAEALSGCASLRSITIPASATSVSPSAGCSALTAISVSPRNSVYRSVDGVLLNVAATEIVWFPMGKTGYYTLPQTITRIGDRAFQGCSVTRFTLTDAVTSLGQAAFAGSQVEEVSLGNGLRTVPTGTFQGCARLRTVRLGSATELVSDYAFDGCPLEHIYIGAQYPPVCNPKALTTSYEQLLSRCTLHVPAARQQLYKADADWGQFDNITGE